jgi:hypothetical protein
LHAALDDRVFDADEFCEPCLQHDFPQGGPQALLSVDAGRMPPGVGNVYCGTVRWGRGGMRGMRVIPRGG